MPSVTSRGLAVHGNTLVFVGFGEWRSRHCWYMGRLNSAREVIYRGAPLLGWAIAALRSFLGAKGNYSLPVNVGLGGPLTRLTPMVAGASAIGRGKSFPWPSSRWSSLVLVGPNSAVLKRSHMWQSSLIVLPLFLPNPPSGRERGCSAARQLPISLNRCLAVASDSAASP